MSPPELSPPSPAGREASPRLTWPTGRSRYAIILFLDAAAISLAFYLAFVIRFEGHIPPRWLAELRRDLPLLVAIRLILHFLFGLHRWSFRFSGLHEAVKVLFTSLAGSGCFVAVFYFMQRAAKDVGIGPPRAVIVIEFFMTTAFIGSLRFSPRFARIWQIDRRRSGKVRALIVGAGSGGELLLRDLQRSDEHPYDVVGFVDDDRSKRGAAIGGRRVLGSLADVPSLARRRDVQELLFAIPRLPASRLREVLGGCADLKLGYKILPVSFAYLKDRAGAAMLQGLAPEHLMPRHEARFSEDDVRPLVQGRRVLITGAGGSVGGEIARQLAPLGPAGLVLLDIHENDLYLLYRHLMHKYPELPLSVEVADIRDARRLQQLALAHRPHHVFHAAAHKHVPLMEEAPEEAVKNNVIGCRNMARAADAAGADTFVLISTDKAVDPSSVLGACKRVAELIVRDQAERSRTRFTSVRFGNVLGSAGSVVPLFASQIAAGGPVTVTHPECRRYLMTLQEAVGLVVLAGLRCDGDLSVLEMGEPIRILDLARLMITMAGLVPDKDVRIVFMGLRPGEKLQEQLLTAQEAARTQRVHDLIRVLDSPPPGPELAHHLERLEALAARGERASIVAALAVVVPSFRPGPAWGELSAREPPVATA